ncbi:MAG: DUF4129 domain-containing protein [Chloroflexi bacterium]|nr:DUF4129 domain-containing protein [Chloroflexota bacterium]
MTSAAQTTGSQTSASPAVSSTEGRKLSFYPIVQGALWLWRYGRPADGWAAVFLLALNLLVVAWSVDRGGDWVPTPSLETLILIAMATGLALSRIPVWGALLLPLGVLIGLWVVTAQLTGFEGEGIELASAAELYDRLGLWWAAAQAGGINIDRVPFAFALMCLTWLAGYLAAWVFSRYRSFWGVFALGGAALLSNLTFLPSEGITYLVFYLFTGLLLVARVQAVRRLNEWRERGFQADSHLGILSISDSVIVTFMVLLVAFLVVPRIVPGDRFWQEAHDVYEYTRSPYVQFEEDFNRLFAGLPARKPLPYRIWSDVMAFQGTINPTTTPVLQVESPVAMYWKARSYGTYTPKGWMSENTELQPTDWTPSHSVPQPYEKRFEVTHTLTTNYRTRNLFAGGQIISSDRDVRIETYDSPVYNIDLSGPLQLGQSYPKLDIASVNLDRVLREAGPTAGRSQLAQSVPDGFHLVDVARDGDHVREVTLAEVLPEQPDTLSIRSADKEFKRGETYEVTSSVSLATAEDLRLAGLDYPTWALDKYTALPPELPQRVRDLGRELAAEADTPYDKAKAIEAHLKTLPYSLSIQPPPYDADGVDYFLFEQKTGYSEYFASAMTVLLRTQGIPARMVTGYTVGNQVPDHEVYVVTDSHSHGWVEVFFPRYGWISFEPTPGSSIPVAMRPVAEEGFDLSGLTSTALEIPLCEFEDEEDCEEDFFPESPAGLEEGSQIIQLLQQYLPWIGGVLAFMAAMGLTTWFLWRRFLSPSPDPEVAFRRLANLGRLNAVGPASYQTPFQYMERLYGEMPDHRQQLSIIGRSYVGHLYGRRETTEEDADRLVQAWLEIRMPLLFHMLQSRRQTTEGAQA